jgi:transposase
LKRQVLACAVMHADETPVAMLAPGKGKTHRAYLWAYAAGAFEPLRAVVYDFTISRAGEHVRAFLKDGDGWVGKGKLVCDGCSYYDALWASGMTECGCMAHARRYFFELAKDGKSPVAATALEFIGQLYGIERDVKAMPSEQDSTNASNVHGRSPRRCTPGLSPSAPRSSTAARPPKPSTTPLSVGRR